jgi:hypothetical protein
MISGTGIWQGRRNALWELPADNGYLCELKETEQMNPLLIRDEQLSSLKQAFNTLTQQKL